ncbi:IucA/IucC family protein [Paenibacillus methanolicus]|uniref:Siderophore synthetase component n=1 Tax=Paenibacillus methanolicus TaxID=582686 RepID=A0A5S5BUE1_9BACL|nr:IucA/IucC family protein [Paenibacillus methanolicus]TYP70619.1 siderophore synthetase component [Paenibacillus methanolicus]
MKLSKLQAKEAAGNAAMQTLLNCYIRETGQGEFHLRADNGPAELEDQAAEAAKTRAEDGRREMLALRLARQAVTIQAGVTYKSPTARHLFAFPVRIAADGAESYPADYVTLSALLAKEIALEFGQAGHADELMLRIIQSCRNVEEFVLARSGDRDKLYGPDADYIDAEQALVFGHLLHPTPKSRQGIPEADNAIYSPELGGAFQLHYFRAHRSLVVQGSALVAPAAELILSELRGDPQVSRAWLDTHASSDEWALLPVHPLQADWLLAQANVQHAIAEGKLQYLGAAGSPYQATSSLRTVYRNDARFMYKLSIPVKVTNSLRVNKYKELERGVEVKRLLETEVGRVREEYEGFDIIADPAFITLCLTDGEDESGFELVLRDNPFRWQASRGASPVAALVQDPLPGERSKLAAIIGGIAQREGRALEEVSADWFDRYLDISLKPMVRLYMKWGIALEAHQQNSVVQLEDGYPKRFYYRDNQGYYFCKSTEALLAQQLPGIGEASQTVCDDAIADERFRYYLIFNHMFGLINGFGAAGLIDERVLLGKLRAALVSFVPDNREPSVFLATLLHDEQLPCKANLLTRLHDMDELVGSLDTQSVYVIVPNPLVKEVADHAEQGGAAAAITV